MIAKLSIASVRMVLDLNDAHKGLVQRYNAFFKGKRECLLNDRNTDKEEFKSDRIDSSQVYNASDVDDLIEQYHAQLMGTLRQEITQLVDFSAVYVTQVLTQVQQYGMTLDAGVDISLVEDRNRVAALHSLDGQAVAPLAPAQRASLASLSPIQHGGTADLAMVQEAQGLKEENQRLMERQQKMQSEASSLLQERSALSSELEKVKQNFAMLREQINGAGLDSASSVNVQEIERSLTDTRGLLDARNAECVRLSQEMNQRLGDSSQFREMKVIVKKKSDEVKMLRRAMQAHGLEAPAMEGGIDLAPEDD